ncbi:MAG: bifunctional precorrin-2 dehydrogenase/sirohydrochlorin ferrochelatase [Actinomycetota bacterium]
MLSNTPTYPVHLIVRGRPALVVGAGNVALHKTRGLVDAGAQVTVVGPIVHPQLRRLPVTIAERAYRAGEVTEYRLAIACTDDPVINHQVFVEGDAAGVWVNSADDPDNCAWILPSVTRHGDLTITASTNGRSPAMASWLRRRFEAEFDDRYLDLLELLTEARAESRAHFGTSEQSGWKAALDDGLFELVAAGHITDARAQLRDALGLPVGIAA